MCDSVLVMTPEAFTKQKAKHARNWRQKRKERRKSDPELALKMRNEKASERKRYKIKADGLIKLFQSEGCLMCGETDSACLQAHHIDPAQKEIEIAKLRAKKASLLRLVSELAKCVCLCANCHFKLHAGRFTLT